MSKSWAGCTGWFPQGIVLYNVGPFVELSDVEEEKMKRPARQKRDHTVPLRPEREIKGQFQVHSSSPSMCLGTRKSGLFLISVLRKVTERSPKSGDYGKFSNAHSCAQKLPPIQNASVGAWELLILQGSTKMFRTRRKNIHWCWF